MIQTQVFDLESDKNGYIWIGTAGGVSRFDGREFVNFSSEKGLTDNFISKIQEHKNIVWISSKFGITSIEGKKIISWDLRTISKDNGINCFTFDKNDNLWISVVGKGVYKIPIINKKLDLSKIINYSINPKNKINIMFCDREGLLWAGGKNTLGFFSDDLWKFDDTQIYDYKITSFSQSRDGEIMYSTQKNGLFSIKKNKIVPIPYSRNFGFINSIYNDSKDRFWVSTKNGAYMLENEVVTHFTKSNGLSNNIVNKIIEDREGNIWIGTDGGGIMMYLDDEFLTYNTQDGLADNNITSINKCYDKGIYISTKNGFVNRYYNNTIKTENNLTFGTIYSSVMLKDSTYLIAASNGVYVLNVKGKTKKILSKKVNIIKKDLDGYIWLGTDSYCYKVKYNSKAMTLSNIIKLEIKNTKTIEAISNNEVWIGGNNGISVVKKDSIYSLNVNVKDVNSIKNVNNITLIGTNNGLFKQSKDSLIKIHITESFSGNNINFIGVEDSNFVWVGTNYGVFELDCEKLKYNSNYILNHYTTSNGLPSVNTNFNSFYKDSYSNIWIGTDKGLVKYKRKNKNSTQPIVKINKVQLFLKNTNWKDFSNNIDETTKLPVNLSVNYNNNYFTFYYNGIAMLDNNNLKYSVFLEGIDKKWSPTTNQKSITYTNLPYGDYTFKVRGAVDDKNWGEYSSFSFSIEKPYFLSWWFILLIIILISITIFVIWKWRKNISKRKLLTKELYYRNKLLALENQTLNYSMNRHFIFNSLNSIQYYLNTKDRISANKYLTNFARLIRKNLDSTSTKNNLVKLSDELERLELYLSLENMRFKNKFSYNISIDKSININEIEIPPMLLQPFVENCIWHGILPLETEGNIIIDIKEIDNNIRIKIQDNGLGINESIRNKKNSNHKSKGMSITKGRLEVLKMATKKEIKVVGPYQVEDENKKILGTRVDVVIYKNTF